MSGLRVLLAPFGSEGDVNPLLWAGRALAAHGHRPEILLPWEYGPLAGASGIPWHPVGEPGEFAALVRGPRLWHPLWGPRRVAAAMLETFHAHAAPWQRLDTPPDIVVASTFGLAALARAEALGIPRIAIHMQPAVLFSAGDFPVLAPGMDVLRSLPLPVRRIVLRAMLDLGLDAQIRRPLNALRAGLGLAPVRDVHREVFLGGDAVGAFFPAWFSSPEAGWPRQIRALGFPLPLPTPKPLPPEIAAFLEREGPPLVWTHGSANFDTERFARIAFAASAAVGQPCLLVCKEPPRSPVPQRALHATAVPFEDLFPRALAAIHHGGIGTTAKAIAAAIPQLVIPRAHDQPDNAARVARLGMGLRVSYPFATPRRVARALGRLLADGSFREAAARCARHPAADPDAFAAWVAEVAVRR